MQNRHKKIKSGKFGRQAWTSIWCLSSRVILPLFCLAACQPATVQLENKVKFTKSYMKVAQINNEQTNKNMRYCPMNQNASEPQTGSQPPRENNKQITDQEPHHKTQSAQSHVRSHRYMFEQRILISSLSAAPCSCHWPRRQRAPPADPAFLAAEALLLRPPGHSVLSCAADCALRVAGSVP